MQSLYLTCMVRAVEEGEKQRENKLYQMVTIKMQVWLLCLALVGLVLMNHECAADPATDNANPAGGSGSDAAANPAVMGKSATGPGKAPKETGNANPAGGSGGGDVANPAVMGKSTTGPGKQTVSVASMSFTPSGEHHMDTETFEYDP